MGKQFSSSEGTPQVTEAPRSYLGWWRVWVRALFALLLSRATGVVVPGCGNSH